jgi:hypothetical protein
MSPLGTWTSGRTGVSKVDMLSMRGAEGWFLLGAAAEWFQQPLSRFALVQTHAQQQHYTREVFVRFQLNSTMRTACCSASQKMAMKL